MEPSKILGCKEECSSSVSGWTMYLGSPVHENDNYDEDRYTYGQGDTCKRDIRHHDDDDDATDKSDDSMASDASSGPSHQELPIPRESRKLSLDKATSKYSSKQKLHKQKTKRDESRIKGERDEKPVLKPKGTTTSQARSGAKVSKSKQMGR